MKIVGIAGSMNKSSTTKQAVAIVLDAAKAAGADIEMIHLETGSCRFTTIGKTRRHIRK
nr:NAD(P)H-dependent oxidoreductase [Brevibacillus agri]